MSSGSPVLLLTESSSTRGLWEEVVMEDGFAVRTRLLAAGCTGFNAIIHLLAPWPWAGNFMSLCARFPG